MIPTLYKRLVNSLSVGFAYAIHVVNQFMSDPRITHHLAAKRNLQFQRNTNRWASFLCQWFS